MFQDNEDQLSLHCSKEISKYAEFIDNDVST